MTKKEAGRLGALATKAKYGEAYSAHMSEIGKVGYKVTTSRYQVLPGRINEWVMVHRETGVVKAVWH